MYPDAPFASDAREAIETLDRLQTSQVLLMAAEHMMFRLELERDPRATLDDNGFYLSENGFESLRQMLPGSDEEVPSPRIRYH